MDNDENMCTVLAGLPYHNYMPLAFVFELVLVLPSTTSLIQVHDTSRLI